VPVLPPEVVAGFVVEVIVGVSEDVSVVVGFVEVVVGVVEVGLGAVVVVGLETEVVEGAETWLPPLLWPPPPLLWLPPPLAVISTKVSWKIRKRMKSLERLIYFGKIKE